MADRIYTVEEHGPRIEDFLRGVIRAMGFDLGFQVQPGDNPHPDIEDPELVVRFHGEDLDLLLANKAELLLALEFLTMEALRIPSDHHDRLCFDANDHRMMRIAELRLSAQTAAEKVKKSKMLFRFSPMSSRERRVIHLALRNETELRSESAGVGPGRHVVIYPAGMPTPPDPPEGYPTYPPRPAGSSSGDRGGPPRRSGPGGGDRGGRPGGGGFGGRGGGSDRGRGGDRGGGGRRP